jgi:hypothetical protein
VVYLKERETRRVRPSQGIREERLMEISADAWKTNVRPMRMLREGWDEEYRAVEIVEPKREGGRSDWQGGAHVRGQAAGM